MNPPQSLLYFITYIYMTIIIINLEFAKFTILCFCVNNCFGRVFSVCNFEWCNVAKVNIKVHCKIFLLTKYMLFSCKSCPWFYRK